MKTILAVLMAMTVLLAACGSDGTEVDAAEGDAAEGDVDGPEVEAESTSDASDAPGGSAGDPGGQASAGFGLNGFRYCEILMTVPGDDGAPVTEIWGTPGVGPCEDDDWYAIDPDALMAELDATWILMNGPRYFTVDGAVDTAPAGTDTATEVDGEIRNFGSIPMTLLATLGEASDGDDPYRPTLVARTTTWTINSGTEVYELTDPEGNTYVMQSYALIHDPELTAEDLASLGDRLDLPEGWSYDSRVIDQDIQVALTADGAIVVQDELENSYQRN